MNPEELSAKLTRFLKDSHEARSVEVKGLRRLTGGASRQTWSFDAVVEFENHDKKTHALILRSDPRPESNAKGREGEYLLIKAAGAEGVAVPAVHLMGDDSIGVPFFLMERVEGETIPRKLLRDDVYARARQTMTGQLGAILAKIHKIPIQKHKLDFLPAPPPDRSPAEEEINRYEQTYRAISPEPHPVFELAFRWLRGRLPPAKQRAVVHGDYRLGNVMFGIDGVRAILDWELAHIGDPMEDLGWMCVRSWRFGNDDLPVGGIGTREEFWKAYEKEAGIQIDKGRVRFWEAFGNLRWGIICISQARIYLSGLSQSVELASIGRRIAETEWELLNLMEESA